MSYHRRNRIARRRIYPDCALHDGFRHLDNTMILCNLHDIIPLATIISDIDICLANIVCLNEK